MMISIVIPTYHRLLELEKCLECLHPDRQHVDASLFEIIVSDDGNKVQAKSFIEQKFPRVRWVEGPKKGPAANRNYGASKALGEWIIFTDDDCLPGESWISEYIKKISNYPNARVFEGKTLPIDIKTRFDEECPENTTGGNLWSCNFCILKSYFQSLNGFDEDFPYAAMEDTDLRIRIQATNESIVFCDQAIIHHPWVIRNNLKGVENHFNSTLIFLKKHPQLRKNINGVYYLRWLVKDFIHNF